MICTLNYSCRHFLHVSAMENREIKIVLIQLEQLSSLIKNLKFDLSAPTRGQGAHLLTSFPKSSFPCLKVEYCFV